MNENNNLKEIKTGVEITKMEAEGQVKEERSTINAGSCGEPKQWYDNAKNMTLDNLPYFINHLTQDYTHDYDTVVHAISAAMLATMNAMNNAPGFGITGYQASFIMWEMVHNISFRHNKTGLKIVDYDNFLCPQYNYLFEKTINKNTWVSLQRQAADYIKHNDYAKEAYAKELEEWESDMADFIKTHPDYDANREQYKLLTYINNYGNIVDSDGNEINPNDIPPEKPYDPSCHPDVYKHWQSIVAGVIPFGYTISEEE